MYGNRSNIQGFGNDEFCRILTHGNETINTVPDPDTFTEVSYNGNGGSNHTGYLQGTAIPTQSSGTYKFGSKSWYFDVYTDTSYIEFGTSGNQDWNLTTADFTIDFWIKYNSIAEATEVSVYTTICGIYLDENTFNLIGLDSDASTTNLVWWIREDGSTKVLAEVDVTSLEGEFFHVAAIRSANYYYVFVNGDRGDRETYATALSSINRPFMVGDKQGNTMNIDDYYIDEFRLSKGIARWTNDFIVPNREY